LPAWQLVFLVIACPAVGVFGFEFLVIACPAVGVFGF